MINWIKVQSTVISVIAYEEISSVLYIKFIRDGIYEYYRVSKHVYEGLKNAPSKGKYFDEYIRVVYTFKKIN